jgi:hypothetical protein
LSVKNRAASAPINPAEPVIIAMLMAEKFRQRRIGSS